MPTLRPQRLSGLVVIPTVEHVSGIHSVSLAIDVGMSRTPPPQVVNREDLVVELRNPVEGSFEPIASPDPGPLPVRAIRVEQARAEYTFAQGVNAPTELVVTLLGDQKTFPLSQTYSPTACLGREPKPGGSFPSAPGTRPPVLQRLIPPILRPGCCVRQLQAPLNPSTDPTAKSESFQVAAAFSAQGRRCRCTCCEYRQFVRGTFTDANGAAVRFDMPSGPLQPGRYCEDGAIDEFGPGKHGYYGHRGSGSPGDEYGGTGSHKECEYRAKVKPSCPPSDSLHLEFLGMVIDRCRGTMAASFSWVIDL
jgi:hypothetical protein